MNSTIHEQVIEFFALFYHHFSLAYENRPTWIKKLECILFVIEGNAISFRIKFPFRTFRFDFRAFVRVHFWQCAY